MIAAFVVDRMGRKPTMGNMCVVSSILLLPLLIPQNEALTTILLSGARTFVSATSTVMAVFIREVIIIVYVNSDLLKVPGLKIQYSLYEP